MCSETVSFFRSGNRFIAEDSCFLLFKCSQTHNQRALRQTSHRTMTVINVLRLHNTGGSRHWRAGMPNPISGQLLLLSSNFLSINRLSDGKMCGKIGIQGQKGRRMGHLKEQWHDDRNFERKKGLRSENFRGNWTGKVTGIEVHWKMSLKMKFV